MKYFKYNLPSYFLFLISVTLAIENTGLKKCKLEDIDCKKKLYETMFRKIAVNGEPSLKIPIMDPFILNNVANILPDDVKITLINGTVEGLRNCNFIHFKTFPKDKDYVTYLDVTCNVEIEGDYEVSFPNELLVKLGGEDLGVDVIKTEGKGKILMDYFEINLTIPFKVEKKDGNYYFIIGDFKMEHNVPEVTSFSHLQFDEQKKINNDKIVEYLKEHSSQLFPANVVMDNVYKFYHYLMHDFLGNIPANDFIEDEFTKALN